MSKNKNNLQRPPQVFQSAMFTFVPIYDLFFLPGQISETSSVPLHPLIQ